MFFRHGYLTFRELSVMPSCWLAESCYLSAIDAQFLNILGQGNTGTKYTVRRTDVMLTVASTRVAATGTQRGSLRDSVSVNLNNE